MIMEEKDYKYQAVVELSNEFQSVQSELNNKIEDYVISTLNKFNENYIAFDGEYTRMSQFFVRETLASLYSIELNKRGECNYIELYFIDNYNNDFCASLCELSTEQQLTLIEDIKEYIQKYGYKNSTEDTFNNSMDFKKHLKEVVCFKDIDYINHKRNGSEDVVSIAYCPNCKKYEAVPLEANYCPMCGNELQEAVKDGGIDLHLSELEELNCKIIKENSKIKNIY